MRARSVSGQDSHIPLDRRTFLQWLSRWWRGQHESGSTSFNISHWHPSPGAYWSEWTHSFPHHSSVHSLLCLRMVAGLGGLIPAHSISCKTALAGGGPNATRFETTRVHHAARRRGGVASHGARATAASGYRYPEQSFAGD